MVARYYNLVHARPPVVYRSSTVSIREVRSDAHEPSEYALQQGAVLFVRGGTFAGCMGRHTFELDANYLFLGNDRDYFYPITNGAEGYGCTIIQYVGAAFDSPVLHERLLLCSSSAYLLHAQLLYVLRSGAPEATVDTVAIALIRETLGGTSKQNERRYEPTQMVCAIKEQVHRSLSSPVSLTALSRQFYRSPFAVSRAFHQEAGISLRRYSQRLRLRRALMLMLEQNATLSEIAASLGFYDEPHFSKAFHAEFGVPPGRAFSVL